MSSQNAFSTRFINHLRKLDSGAYATLRRGLTYQPDPNQMRFAPEQHIRSFRHIERFVNQDEGEKDSKELKKYLYLVAGLYCLRNRANASEAPEQEPADSADLVNQNKELAPKNKSTKNNFGETVGRFHLKKYREIKMDDSLSSLEMSFLRLLDSDYQQFVHYMRQLVQLTDDEPIDWDALISDVSHWEHPSRWVQKNWAESFYRAYLPQKED